MFTKLTLFLLLGITSLAVFGQTPVLVKDINPSGNADVLILNNPFGVSTLYFFADDGTHGWELWKTNGTAATTQLVKDINPGLGAGICDFDAEKPAFVWLDNNTLLFAANDGTNGCELWKSDGTASGTLMLKNINAQTNGNSNPNYFVRAGNKAYFIADDWDHYAEVWTTDGTTVGTHLVKDIYGFGTSYPNYLCPLGSKVVFFAFDGSSTSDHGSEPWISDGTEAGTFMLKDINEGSYDAELPGLSHNCTFWNGKVYFAAANYHIGTQIGNYELWVTDGTNTGTYLFKEIDSNPTLSGIPQAFVAGSNALYFLADNGQTTGRELWKTDGTPVGTQLVKDIWQGNISSLVSNMRWLNDRLYFSAQNGSSSANELWVSDGTELGTQQISEINTFNYGSSNPIPLAKIGNAVYCWADSDMAGTELFRAENNSAEMVSDLNTNYNINFGSSYSNDGYSDFFSLIGNKLYFAANSNAAGLELFALDLTSTGIGTQEQFAENTVHLFPNPCANYIYFDTPTICTSLVLFNSNGQQINKWENALGQLIIPTEQLPTGLYWLIGYGHKWQTQAYSFVKK